MSVNLYVSIAPSHIFISAQIQIVNSNSKLYVVYTLYIIRDTAVVSVCYVMVGWCGAILLLWVDTVSLVEKCLLNIALIVSDELR